MIKIELKDSTKKTLENRHWKWFLSHLISTYKNTNNLFQSIAEVRKFLKLKNNKELKQLVVGDFFPLLQRIGSIELKDEIKEKDPKKNIIYDYGLESYLREQQSIEEYNANISLLTQKFAQFFNYKSFERSTKWNPYLLFELININVCPYCNRQYIFTIKTTKQKIVRPELDHFYPQEKYPYLATSLYNFIPACHTCNHIKRDKGENIIYPYNEGFLNAYGHKDGKFIAAFPKTDVTNWSIREIQNIKFRIDLSNCHDHTKKIRMDNSINTFHLEQIYNTHQIEIKDLFLRYSNYSHPKRMDILRLFYKKGLKKNKEKQIDKILSIYAMKMKKVFLGLPLGVQNEQYPLRKFKEDIIEQLDEAVEKMRKEKI